MKTLTAILFTTLYGLSVRLLFGFFDGILGIMSLSFLVLVPMLIGFLTVILLPYKEGNTATGAFFKPWITCLILLGITIALSIEGAICWIMIFPFFAVAAGFGGVIAHNIKKKRAKTDIEMDIDQEGWEQRNTLKFSLFYLIPVVFGLLEGQRVLRPKEMEISRTVEIAAAPEAVWKTLTSIDTIQTAEHHRSFAGMLGFPHHVKTTLDKAAVGGKRTAIYEKGLYFTETITRYEPNHVMALDVKTDPTKIPPTVLDEHIVIGGKHVDILEDVYQLTVLPNGHAQLTLSSRFYINTPFNWYAGIWANYLMADILQGELNLVKERTEQ